MNFIKLSSTGGGLYIVNMDRVAYLEPTSDRRTEIHFSGDPHDWILVNNRLSDICEKLAERNQRPGYKNGEA